MKPSDHHSFICSLCKDTLEKGTTQNNIFSFSCGHTFCDVCYSHSSILSAKIIPTSKCFLCNPAPDPNKKKVYSLSLPIDSNLNEEDKSQKQKSPKHISSLPLEKYQKLAIQPNKEAIALAEISLFSTHDSKIESSRIGLIQPSNDEIMYKYKNLFPLISDHRRKVKCKECNRNIMNECFYSRGDSTYVCLQCAKYFSFDCPFHLIGLKYIPTPSLVCSICQKKTGKLWKCELCSYAFCMNCFPGGKEKCMIHNSWPNIVRFDNLNPFPCGKCKKLIQPQIGYKKCSNCSFSLCKTCSPFESKLPNCLNHNPTNYNYITKIYCSNCFKSPSVQSDGGWQCDSPGCFYSLCKKCFNIETHNQDNANIKNFANCPSHSLKLEWTIVDAEYLSDYNCYKCKSNDSFIFGFWTCTKKGCYFSICRTCSCTITNGKCPVHPTCILQFEIHKNKLFPCGECQQFKDASFGVAVCKCDKFYLCLDCYKLYNKQ